MRKCGIRLQIDFVSSCVREPETTSEYRRTDTDVELSTIVSANYEVIVSNNLNNDILAKFLVFRFHL